MLNGELKVGFLAVRQHLRLVLEVLLRLDECERVAQSFVLDECRVADALVVVEDATGKSDTFPSQFQRSVYEVVQFDVLACKFLFNFVLVEDDLLPVVGHCQLGADVALFAMA